MASNDSTSAPRNSEEMLAFINEPPTAEEIASQARYDAAVADAHAAILASIEALPWHALQGPEFSIDTLPHITDGLIIRSGTRKGFGSSEEWEHSTVVAPTWAEGDRWHIQTKYVYFTFRDLADAVVFAKKFQVSGAAAASEQAVEAKLYAHDA